MPRVRRRADDGDRRPGVRGRARTRRDEHAAVRPAIGPRRVGDRVGLDEIGLGAELVQVPDEGVDEAVVVVDDEDPRDDDPALTTPAHRSARPEVRP